MKTTAKCKMNQEKAIEIATNVVRGNARIGKFVSVSFLDRKEPREPTSKWAVCFELMPLDGNYFLSPSSAIVLVEDDTGIALLETGGWKGGY